ncbi:GtrA family protein [Terrisporobacter sp.]
MFTIKYNLTKKTNLNKKKIIEYLKFNIIGILNFTIAQMFYLTLYLFFKINYIVAYTLTSIISISASYYFNSKYTFKQNKYSLKKYLLSFLVYLFEYTFNLSIILTLVNIFKVSKVFAPFVSPVFSTIPVFFLMRFVIKHSK